MPAPSRVAVPDRRDGDRADRACAAPRRFAPTGRTTRSAATTRSMSRATCAVRVTPSAEGCDLAEIAAPVAAAASGVVRRLRRGPEGSRSAHDAGRPRGQARSDGADRQERQGRTDHGRRHVQRAGQLDVVAAARARRDARGGLSLHRHAGARLRRAAACTRTRASRRSPPSSARATSCSCRRDITRTSARRGIPSTSSG